MPATLLFKAPLAIALVSMLASACGTETPDAPAPAVAPVAPVAEQPAGGKEELLVLAATSLTDAFKQLERELELKHPNVDVLLSFAGSSAIALQIDQGGAGDVLATANEEHLQKLVKAGLIQDHAVFAHNELVVAVAKDNPAKIGRFEDLANAKRIVLGAPNVPAGQYADALLKRAGETLGAKFSEAVQAHVVSREANVRLVLPKVELGEADAAIVYRTDIRRPECKPAPAGTPHHATACGHAHAIEVPAALSERATFPIGVATRSKQPKLARMFIEYVLSPEGQAALAANGFIPARPPASTAEPKK
jgi:molybdate transport system substrate-binding protein